MDRGIGDERRLGRARVGKHERATRARGPVGHRERAADRAQVAGERQLARELMRREPLGRDLRGGREDAERDRQVEPAALLGQVRRCEVDGDAARGELEAAVLTTAARTRSRASFTSVSGRPTIVKLGRPFARCTSTVTSGASMPASARL